MGIGKDSRFSNGKENAKETTCPCFMRREIISIVY